MTAPLNCIIFKSLTVLDVHSVISLHTCLLPAGNKKMTPNLYKLQWKFHHKPTSAATATQHLQPTTRVECVRWLCAAKLVRGNLITLKEAQLWHCSASSSGTSFTAITKKKKKAERVVFSHSVSFMGDRCVSFSTLTETIRLHFVLHWGPFHLLPELIYRQSQIKCLSTRDGITLTSNNFSVSYHSFLLSMMESPTVVLPLNSAGVSASTWLHVHKPTFTTKELIHAPTETAPAIPQGVWRLARGLMIDEASVTPMGKYDLYFTAGWRLAGGRRCSWRKSQTAFFTTGIRKWMPVIT